MANVKDSLTITLLGYARVFWLKNREACELTTPFLDRHNDHLQVYATRRNGSFVLSDDGYVLSDLRTSGLEIDTPKRKIILESVLNGLGVAQKIISWS